MTVNSKTSYTKIHKQCLNLGITVADLTLAIKSEDPKTISEASERLLAFASYLGFSSDIKPEINEIKALADKREWSRLLDTINNVQAKVVDILTELDSSDQITLISLGGWIEGLHVVTNSLKNDYDKKATEILRMTAQIDYFLIQLGKLDKTYADQKEVKMLLTNLPLIRKECDIKRNSHISKRSIKKLNKITEDLINQFKK